MIKLFRPVLSFFFQGLFFKDINDDNKIVRDLYYELNELKLISKNNKISMYDMGLNSCFES